MIQATNAAEPARLFKRILVVDDYSPTRQLIIDTLNQAGYHAISEAENGREALEKFTQHHFDLVISDVMMPGMTGYQVVAKLKDDIATQNIPVILVTALDVRKARIAGLSGGADDVLAKPLDRAQLILRVRNLLSRKTPPGAGTGGGGDGGGDGVSPSEAA